VRQAQGGIKEAEAKLAQAQQALAQFPKLLEQQQQLIVAEQAKLKGAKTVYDQAVRAQAKSFATAEQVEAAKALVTSQEAAMSAAETKLEQIKGSKPDALLDEAKANVEYRHGLLDEAQAFLESHTLRARGAGKVLRVLARPGTVFGPNSKQPAFWFQPAGALVIRAEVEQETAHRLKLGLSAVVQDDVQPDAATWKAKVTRIADSYLPKRPTSAAGVDPFVLNEAKVLECILEITTTGKEPTLRLGQKVRVNLGTE
jgi:multidrug resistance efflux pump